MSHLKILGPKRVTWSKIHTVNVRMLGATAKNVLDRVNWHTGSVHPCSLHKHNSKSGTVKSVWWQSYGKHNQGITVRFLVEAKSFSHLQIVKTNPPTSQPTAQCVPEVLYREGKASEAWTWMSDVKPPLPNTPQQSEDGQNLPFNTLRTGLLNCLHARSRGLTFRHRASCI